MILDPHSIAISNFLLIFFFFLSFHVCSFSTGYKCSRGSSKSKSFCRMHITLILLSKFHMFQARHQTYVFVLQYVAVVQLQFCCTVGHLEVFFRFIKGWNISIVWLIVTVCSNMYCIPLKNRDLYFKCETAYRFMNIGCYLRKLLLGIHTLLFIFISHNAGCISNLFYISM